MYLNSLPINILSLDHVEADDTIAFCTSFFKPINMVTIMSADKDFLQLTDEHVKVWSPSKKKLYGMGEVLAEYGIHPYNFAVFRAMDGDASDNIDGIRGAGPKTIAKAFPCLREPRVVPLTEIYDICTTKQDKLKIYDTVLQNKTILERNYELMQLHNTQLSSIAQLHVTDVLNGEIPKLNRIDFIRMLNEDRMWNNIPNSGSWLTECFNKLNSYTRS
jgi:5'-3' exonuclease